MMKKSAVQAVGAAWLVFLAVAYFIPIDVETGGNYLVRDSLLGMMIFHNLYLLALYVLLGVLLFASNKILKIKVS